VPSTVRLFFDAIVAVAFMATFASIAAFAAAAVTSDRTIIVVTAASVFALTGAVLLVRLWRITHGPDSQIGPSP
jgi:hypothetical protein